MAVYTLEQKQQRRQTWQFFAALNAPILALAVIHVVNNPNLYHYILTEFVDEGLLGRNRLNTALGGLSILGLITAAFAQPAFGLLSDRTRTRWGPRYPYFIWGTCGALLTLLLIINAASWPMLLFAVIAVQIMLNAVQSPVQAMIPDHVQPERMGLASSIKTILELVGVISSGIVVWFFLGRNTQPELAILFVWVCLVIAVFFPMRAAPYDPENAPNARQEAMNRGQRFVRMYHGRTNSRLEAQALLIGLSLRHILRQASLRWWLLGRFFFYAAFNTIGKFAITYLTDVFEYSAAEARALQGMILVVIGIMIFIATIAAGILSDRVGRKQLATIGAIIAMLACSLLVFNTNLNIAIALICIIGIGCGIFFSTGWALVTYLVPVREAAFYLGVMNVATTLGGAFGMLGGYLIDVVNDNSSDPATGYMVLFAVLTGFFAIGALSTHRVTDPHAESLYSSSTG